MRECSFCPANDLEYSDDIAACESCGIPFCGNCGDIDLELCQECLPDHVGSDSGFSEDEQASFFADPSNLVEGDLIAFCHHCGDPMPLPPPARLIDGNLYCSVCTADEKANKKEPQYALASV